MGKRWRRCCRASRGALHPHWCRRSCPSFRQSSCCQSMVARLQPMHTRLHTWLQHDEAAMLMMCRRRSPEIRSDAGAFRLFCDVWYVWSFTTISVCAINNLRVDRSTEAAALTLPALLMASCLTGLNSAMQASDAQLWLMMTMVQKREGPHAALYKKLHPASGQTLPAAPSHSLPPSASSSFNSQHTPHSAHIALLCQITQYPPPSSSHVRVGDGRGDGPLGRHEGHSLEHRGAIWVWVVVYWLWA